MYRVTLSNGLEMYKSVSDLQDWLICGKLGQHFMTVLETGKLDTEILTVKVEIRKV